MNQIASERRTQARRQPDSARSTASCASACSRSWRSCSDGRLRARRCAAASCELGTPSRTARPLHVAHAASTIRRFYRAARAPTAASAPARRTWTATGHCDDLVALVRLLVRNRDLLDGMETGLARLGGLAMRGVARAAPQYARRQPPQHRRALRPRQRFLRPVPVDDLMYSSAICARRPTTRWKRHRRASSTASASKLDLQPGDRVRRDRHRLGRLRAACRAPLRLPRHHHHDLARAACAGRERIADGRPAATASRCCCEDYRDLAGSYDKLVSIEMIEAIGAPVPGHLFRQDRRACSSPTAWRWCRRSRSRTTATQQALHSVDFIKRHVFPGQLHSVDRGDARGQDAQPATCALIAPGGLRPVLRAARCRPGASASSRTLPQVRAQGFDERFMRMWEFYLAYCEGGFRERSIGDVQMLLAKPGNRRALRDPHGACDA